MEHEKLFWGRITSALWKPNRVFIRLELGYADGVPDGVTIMSGSTDFVELKCPVPAANPRANTALFSGQHKLTQEQINWALACRQAGGRWHCAVETPGHVLLLGARYAESINVLPLATLIEMADFAAVRPMNEVLWERFRLALIRKGLP